MLRMEAITKRFGAVTALDGVDLDVRAGEVHALLGENGAGKSTLMHILSGLYRPGSGSIFLEGQPVALHSPQDAARLGVGMVHQHFMLVPVFTVAENIALSSSGSAHGWLDRAEMRENVRRLARRLDWEVDPDAPVMHLPVGVQQRVEILKVLQTDVRLLIFDEPTAVLAPQEIEELFEVFRKLRSEGRSLIFISHKLNEVMAVSDRVTVLRRGQKIGTVLTAQTSPSELAEMMVGRRSEAMVSLQSAPFPEVADQPIVLSIRNLTAINHQKVPALRDVSLEVRQGEIFGIAGVDGNGQPELAEALSGLIRPTGGEIALRGVPVRRLTPDRLPEAGIACIPQDRQRTGLILGMSVAENLALEAHRDPEYRRGPFLKIASLRRLAASLVDEFDIRTPNLEITATSLSGGNQQKIVIARALRRRPDLLVAVNPTRGLDIGATEYVHRKLLEAREAGTAILLISTELDEVLSLSDRVGVMYAGRLMGVVSPDTPKERIGLMMGGREAP